MRDAHAALNRCRCLAFATCLVAALATSSAHAEQLDWLYDASVEIASQAEADQRDAARRALLVVLSRVSGLRHVPRSSSVNAALRNPANFYSQFRFETVSEGDDESLRMVVRFDVAAIMELVSAARLPVWTIDRPHVLLWVVVEEGDDRRLVLPGDPRLETIRLVARARHRFVAGGRAGEFAGAGGDLGRFLGVHRRRVGRLGRRCDRDRAS